MAIKKYSNFVGGLDLNEPTSIDDNAFSVLKNMYYNDKMQLQTRRGYRPIFDSVGSDPFTSFYNYRNDETGNWVTVGFAGDTFYALDTDDERQSVRSGLAEREVYPKYNNARVRLDFAPYRGDLYISDGVNPYAKYNGTNYTQIGLNALGACTFDNADNEVTITGHGLSDNDRVTFGGTGDLPAEIVANQVYYVEVISSSVVKLRDFPNGATVEFTDNGSGSLEAFETVQPQVRYLQYLSERMYAAGDDTTPQTLYYTGALPANAEDIGGNAVIIGGDEGGDISGLSELQQVILVFKTNKIHAVDVVTPRVDAIDTQGGAYANRVINNVENGLLIYTDRGVDQLQARDGVGGSASLFSEPMSEKVRKLFDLVEKNNYRYACGLFSPRLNQFYVSFDTDNDQVPDTTLVWNTKSSSWVEYTLPSMYTFGRFDRDDSSALVFAPAAGGQMFEFEAGFDDNGAEIVTELETKKFDFDDPVQLKTFDFIDISGYKQVNGNIEVVVKVDGDEAGDGNITDGNIDPTMDNGGIGITVLGTDMVGSSSADTEDRLQLYPFNVRIPFYARGSNISVCMRAEGVQWILTQMRISVNGEPVDVFNYGDIL